MSGRSCASPRLSGKTQLGPLKRASFLLTICLDGIDLSSNMTLLNLFNTCFPSLLPPLWQVGSSCGSCNRQACIAS